MVRLPRTSPAITPFVDTGLVPNDKVNLFGVEAAGASGPVYLQSEVYWAVRGGFRVSYDAAYTRFHTAVDRLVSGEGTIHERLAAAYHDAFTGFDGAAELPESLVSEFTDIQRAFEHAAPRENDEEQSEPGLHLISAEEASRLAHRIFELFCELAKRRSAGT